MFQVHLWVSFYYLFLLWNFCCKFEFCIIFRSMQCIAFSSNNQQWMKAKTDLFHMIWWKKKIISAVALQCLHLNDEKSNNTDDGNHNEWPTERDEEKEIENDKYKPCIECSTDYYTFIKCTPLECLPRTIIWEATFLPIEKKHCMYAEHTTLLDLLCH